MIGSNRLSGGAIAVLVVMLAIVGCLSRARVRKTERISKPMKSGERGRGDAEGPDVPDHRDPGKCDSVPSAQLGLGAALKRGLPSPNHAISVNSFPIMHSSEPQFSGVRPNTMIHLTVE
jgi:hypothetical protein